MHEELGLNTHIFMTSSNVFKFKKGKVAGWGGVHMPLTVPALLRIPKSLETQGKLLPVTLTHSKHPIQVEARGAWRRETGPEQSSNPHLQIAQHPPTNQFKRPENLVGQL